MIFRVTVKSDADTDTQSRKSPMTIKSKICVTVLGLLSCTATIASSNHVHKAHKCLSCCFNMKHNISKMKFSDDDDAQLKEGCYGKNYMNCIDKCEIKYKTRLRHDHIMGH